VRNHNKLRALLFNELGDVVQAELDVDGLGTLLGGLVSSGLGKARLLFLAGLWAVFREQFKQFTGLVALNGVAELGDAWRHFEAVHQDALLTLNADVLGPLDEACEVSLRLDVSSDSKVAWVLFEQRIFCCSACT